MVADDFLGTVEVAITTPLLFWPADPGWERGGSLIERTGQ